MIENLIFTANYKFEVIGFYNLYKYGKSIGMRNKYAKILTFSHAICKNNRFILLLIYGRKSFFTTINIYPYISSIDSNMTLIFDNYHKIFKLTDKPIAFIELIENKYFVLTDQSIDNSKKIYIVTL